MTTALKRALGETARDAITVAVRRELPELADNWRSEISLPRSACPQLTPATHAEINGWLPIGWVITDVLTTTFVIVVVGRKAK